MSIYCKQTCPICGNKLHKWRRNRILRYECSDNQCYGYYRYQTKKIIYQVQIIIFGKRYEIKDFNTKTRKLDIFNARSKIFNEIKYWKENDRYVMKLLTMKGEYLLWPKPI